MEYIRVYLPKPLKARFLAWVKATDGGSASSVVAAFIRRHTPPSDPPAKK